MLDIPVFMKEDLVPIIGNENMIQEMPDEFNKVLEVQRSCPLRLRMNLPALNPGHGADNDPVDPGKIN